MIQSWQNIIPHISLRKRVSTAVAFWQPALKQTLPLYLALHGVLIALTLAVASWVLPEPQGTPSDLPHFLSWCLHLWFRWDSGHYLAIAQEGYGNLFFRAAFFPLFPLLIHLLTWAWPHPLLLAVLLAQGAGLVLMIVFYQLAQEEFGTRAARRAICYLFVFPPAFFFWAAYPESLFLCLTVLSFYAMRHQCWWWAGSFGLLACLTRPDGIFLCLPFCFEYLRQHSFRWRALRWTSISCALVPIGLLIYAVYCHIHYGDLLAFSHAQQAWKRSFHLPWDGLLQELLLTIQHLDYPQVRLNAMLNLLPDLFALTLLVLSSLRLCHLGSRHWIYVLYAALLWLFANCFPAYDPLLSVGRHMLSLFPLALLLAQSERFRWLHLILLSASGVINSYLCFQFLIGRAVI